MGADSEILLRLYNFNRSVSFQQTTPNSSPQYEAYRRHFDCFPYLPCQGHSDFSQGDYHLCRQGIGILNALTTKLQPEVRGEVDTDRPFTGGCWDRKVEPLSLHSVVIIYVDYSVKKSMPTAPSPGATGIAVRMWR
jgi:hypothetical protein